MPIVGGPQLIEEPNESKANAPALTPKLWYGMPAYAKDGKVVCFFRTGEKFESRCATFRSNDIATLDDATIWPTALPDEVDRQR
ncbi:hypothetical protein [Nocardia sp. NPDC049707]|uniref:hypothetical protein n=1 Tax=Nocardia sp. NPDC049707 TaxID=3154735 RepID=UPI0034194D09